jgi:outer membrane receptor protein involved in Fe transport
MKNILSLFLCLSIFLISGNIYSQSSNAVEEVIVTATKVEKTLQEVPVSVSVVTADTVEKANILDIFDLKAVVPSLDTRQYQSSVNSTFFIRGFGNGANNPGIEPSVAVFIDGVYRSRIQSQISDLPMIERIEVLRGPQSSLFGKNASAGVVNIVTKKPSFEKTGMVSVGFGNFNSKVGKIYYTGPLNEVMAYSISANVNKRDGHTKNLVTGNTINSRDRFGLRAELLYQPDEDLTVRMTADYDENDEVCCAVGSVSYGAANLIKLAFSPGMGMAANDPFTQEAYFSFDPTSKGDNSGLSVHVTKNLENAVLESITSLRNSYNSEVREIDWYAADVLAPQLVSNDLDSVTQEFRLYSQDNEKINWLIGGFYFQEDMKFNEQLYFGSLWRTYIDAFVPGAVSGVELALGLPAGILYAPGQGVNGTATQDNTTQSIFAQFDIKLTERLDAILGLSYIEDSKTVSYSEINTGVLSSLDFVAIGTGALIGAGIPAEQAAVLALNPEFNPLLPLQALQFIEPFTNYPNAAQDGKTNDDNIDYTARLSFALNDTTSLYGGVSTGYKASAWNISRDSLPDAEEKAGLIAAGTPAHPNQGIGQRYATPEEAEVFELGAKMYLPTGYLNVAIFDQKIKGFQSNTFIGTGFVLANAGSQSADGYEIDLVFSPFESIDVALSGLFIDPIYDSFPNSSAGDLTGTRPSNIPEDTISTNVTWNWNLNGYDGYIRLGHLYASEANLLEDPRAQAVIEATGNGIKKQNTLNISAGIETDKLSVMFYGRNINDDEFLTTAFPEVVDLSQTTFYGYPNNYKTYGLTVNYSF